MRNAAWAILLAGLVGTLATAGCGSHGKGGTGGKGGGGSGGGGSGGASAGSGGATAGSGGASGGTAGATAGAGGDVDAGADAASDVATESPPPIDAADATTATDAGDTRPADALDAIADAAPMFDVGPGCDSVLQANAPPLVPSAEGVPAAGLVLWLRGDRGVYMTPDANAVCAWADQSPQHGLLTASGVRPVWQPMGVGGKDAVHFPPTAKALTTGGVLGIAPKSGRTFIAVQQLVTTTARFGAVMQGQSGTPGTYLNIDTNTFQTAGSREGVYATNNAYDSALATSTAARIHVYTLSTMVPGTPALSAMDYRVNGAAQTLTRTAGGLGDGNLEDFTAADFTAVGIPGADAIVAEVLVYDRALTADEKVAVETALKARYGIP